MRAIQVQRYGGPEVLEAVEVPDPTPGPGEALVRVRAAGLNYIDTYRREGAYPTPLPNIPGVEGAGEIVALGPGADGHGFAVGDRVMWFDVPGSYAQLVAAPLDDLVAVPEEMDDAVAASLLLQSLTAHYLVTDCHRAAPGEWVLVHAAAGGVGQRLVQSATARGYRVVATASSPAKRALAARLGAEVTLDYAEATGERVVELTGGGAGAVFDGVGRATFDESLASLRRRGTLVLYGAASGPVPPFDLQRLNSGGSLVVTRPTLADFVATPDEFASRTAAVVADAVEGRVDVAVSASFPLADAARAHEALESRELSGSIVLVP